MAHPATVTISGFRDRKLRNAVSRGSVTIRTSEGSRGRTHLLPRRAADAFRIGEGRHQAAGAGAIPLIAWRLRNVARTAQHAWCSRASTPAPIATRSPPTARRMGMDLDGPQNDKGLYAISAVQPRTYHPERRRDRLEVLSRTSLRGTDARRLHVAGLSRRAVRRRPPCGVDQDLSRNYYVANFKDYRFLQVFYPTRGILAWYDRDDRAAAVPAGRRRPALTCRPTPSGVPTANTWCSRAPRRKDAYPEGGKIAEYANDPNETADAVRPLPHSLQRRPGRHGGTDRGSVARTA